MFADGADGVLRFSAWEGIAVVSMYAEWHVPVRFSPLPIVFLRTVPMHQYIYCILGATGAFMAQQASRAALKIANVFCLEALILSVSCSEVSGKSADR